MRFSEPKGRRKESRQEKLKKRGKGMGKNRRKTSGGKTSHYEL